MAGNGPPPKPSATRQRRNRTSTAAQLGASKARLPAELPERMIRVQEPVEGSDELELEWVEEILAWHPRSVQYWDLIRKSPVAAEFIQVDLTGLYMLMDLVDDFHWTRNPSLMSEIRLQRQCFGLTPIDRR